MSNSFLIIKPIVTLQYLLIECLSDGFKDKEPNSELLKQREIIPSDWQVSDFSQTIHQSKLSFTNGIEITRQNTAITFSEPINSNISKTARIINIICKYFLDDLINNPKTIYIKFKTFVRFETDNGVEQGTIEDYVISKLIPYNLRNSQLEPYQIDLNYFFKMERASIKFNIQKSELLLPNKQVIPNLLFSGIIPYNIKLGNFKEIENILFSWEKDYIVYINILKEFLQ